MKWEPNIVGYPITLWPRQAAHPSTEGVSDRGHSAHRAHSTTELPKITELSDNIMLAHYQRDRS